MDDARKGQIALLFLKKKMREDGIRIRPNFRREAGNEAKSIGIAIEEAVEFYETLVRELVEEMFSESSGGNDETLKKMRTNEALDDWEKKQSLKK